MYITQWCWANLYKGKSYYSMYQKIKQDQFSVLRCTLTLLIDEFWTSFGSDFSHLDLY